MVYGENMMYVRNKASPWRICTKSPPEKSDLAPLATFFIVFCDFFKSYGSKPLTLIMFFVVLWEVVSPLRAIFDIMTQNRENRKKRVPKWPYFGPFEAFLKVKYSKNQGDDFEWFFKVVLMVLELYSGYRKVFRGFKESIPSLRTCFWALLKKKYDQYSQATMWRSCVLHRFWTMLLLIEDSRKLCLSWIFKSQKCVLRLGIDSLRPQDTFAYPGYNSRTIRTTLKNHSKSSTWFLLYFKKASKEPK